MGFLNRSAIKLERIIGSGKSVDLGIGKSPSVWKVSLEGTGDNPTRTECMDNNHIRIGWDGYGETISDATDYSNDGGSTVLNAFYNRMQIGDIVMSYYSKQDDRCYWRCHGRTGMA